MRRLILIAMFAAACGGSSEATGPDGRMGLSDGTAINCDDARAANTTWARSTASCTLPVGHCDLEIVDPVDGKRGCFDGTGDTSPGAVCVWHLCPGQ
jgi:hypothetical protein